MAGTDRTQLPAEATARQPAIILVRPQLGENIGAAARAMLNFGLTEMRIVKPRGGWPSKAARAMASGADVVLDRARVFATVDEAIGDLARVLATSARPRGMVKRVITPAMAAKQARKAEAAGEKLGILFGPERTGLTNDEVAMADAAIAIPANPSYASFNLAQAVLLLSYEWFRAGPMPKSPASAKAERAAAAPARREDILHLFRHLEDELDRCGFLKPPEKRPRMVRNIRNVFTRAHLTDQEVRTLRGVIVGLVGRPPIPKKPGKKVASP